MDAVQAANSGHPGMPMGMADLAVDVWLRHLAYDVRDADWMGRDRFVLSAGHGSMLLYALLHLSGQGLPIDELKQFRQKGSKTPGHPEVFHTRGVETTTGPLGQGFGNGVGMALGMRMMAERFACPSLATGRVVGIVSDGDLMEGLSQEAASIAGHLKLGQIVYFYDDNSITIDGSTELSFSEDVHGRFEALGWRVLRIENAHDLSELSPVVDQAFQSDGRPTLVVCRTRIGFGSPNKEGTAGSHGAPLGDDEIRLTKEKLGLPADESFWVPDEAAATFKLAAASKSTQADTWHQAFDSWRQTDADRAETFDRFIARDVPSNLYEELRKAVAGKDGATRALSGAVIQRAAELVPSLVTGSADLDASCKTKIKDSGSVTASSFDGRNLHFGIREHAMGAILNGMALAGGHLAAGSTFLVFSDYMRPSVRLAAIMGLPVTFVWTHDSIFVGEDGPTHQPIEQVAALRLIPHLRLWRPADAAEVAAAWTDALTRRDGPVALVLTRQGLPNLGHPEDFDYSAIQHGGYVVFEPEDEARGVIVATGSEVHIAVQAAQQLESEDAIPVRVVSMPCVERFLRGPEDWRKGVLPTDVPVFAVECGRPEGWCQLTGSMDRVIGVQRFGMSAPWQELAEGYGFTAENVAERLRSALK